jgi:hypothetical protein
MDLIVREIGCEILDWTQLAEDMILSLALVNTVMNLKISIRVGIFLTT